MQLKSKMAQLNLALDAAVRQQQETGRSVTARLPPTYAPAGVGDNASSGHEEMTPQVTLDNIRVLHQHDPKQASGSM